MVPLLSFKFQQALVCPVTSLSSIARLQHPTTHYHLFSTVPQDNQEQKPTPKQQLQNPQKLVTLPLDHVYICDANLVIKYINKLEPWSSWVESYLSGGSKLFVLPIAIKEVGKRYPLPEGFVDLSLSCRMPSHDAVKCAFNEIVDDLCLTDKKRVDLWNDITMVLSAGYCATTSDAIATNALLQGKVHFITANMTLLKRAVYTTEKRDLVETAVDRNGLEHLISVIGVFEDKWETFE